MLIVVLILMFRAPGRVLTRAGTLSVILRAGCGLAFGCAQEESSSDGCQQQPKRDECSHVSGVPRGGKQSQGNSKARRPDLESAAPFATRRHTLQFIPQAIVREVEAVGHSGHGLKADEALAGRRISHGHRILRPVTHGDLLILALHPKVRVPVGAANQASESIVQLVPGEWIRVGQIHGPLLASGRHLGVQHLVFAHGQVGVPFIARRVIQLEIGMESDGHGHGVRAQVLQQRFHAEFAVVQLVGHLDGVRERELRHQLRMLPELQATGAGG